MVIHKAVPHLSSQKPSNETNRVGMLQPNRIYQFSFVQCDQYPSYSQHEEAYVTLSSCPGGRTLANINS